MRSRAGSRVVRYSRLRCVLVLPVALGFVRELIVDRRPEGWASSLRLMASRKQGRWIHLEAVLE